MQAIDNTQAAWKKAVFISLEGVDGAGKTTHITWLRDYLQQQPTLEVIFTREPGGTPIGEKMRTLVLSETMQPDTEALLLFAARAEHVQTVIQPALHAQKWVVSDRFTDASFAYQAGGRGIDATRLAALEHWTLGELQPDLTFLFDVPEQVSQARLQQGRTQLDRFEQEKSDFHARVRHAYLARANAMPSRFCVIDGTQCIEQIQAQMLAVLHDRFGLA